MQEKMSDRSPKKKRKASSPSRPTKAQQAAVKVQVESSSPSDNPVVVSFPSGVPESLHLNAPPGASVPEFLWEKLSTKSSGGRKVIGKDKHCTYSAFAAGLAYDDRRTKLCVGVFNKKSRTVVIREAACRGTVFSLQQSIPSYLEKNGSVQFEAGRNLLSYENSVFEDFGSAKKRKALKSQAANRVELTSVVGAGEDSAVAHQVIMGEAMSESNRKAIAQSKIPEEEAPLNERGNKAVDAAHEAARKKFLPAYDGLAVKPHKVYSSRDIAGETAWKRIYNRVHASMHDNDPTESIVGMVFDNAWQPSVLKLVKSINIEASDCKDRFTCALLANDFMRFYASNQRRKSIPSVDPAKKTHFGISIEVASRCVELFTTEAPGNDGTVSHAMSKQDRDRCVVHILLLYMMAHGTAMKIPDLSNIAQDMKLPVNDCAQILRLAGCQISKNGQTLSAVLKTPLQFPRPKRAVNRS
jgi:A49-like RNA polymerase I associated factor